MRSRYSAFALHNSAYIIKTTHQDNSDYTDDKKAWESSIKEFCKYTHFNGLKVLEFIDGQNEAYVTFKAILEQNNQNVSFTEKSKFYKVDKQWLYNSGEFLE